MELELTQKEEISFENKLRTDLEEYSIYMNFHYSDLKSCVIEVNGKRKEVDFSKMYQCTVIGEIPFDVECFDGKPGKCEGFEICLWKTQEDDGEIKYLLITKLLGGYRKGNEHNFIKCEIPMYVIKDNIQDFDFQKLKEFLKDDHKRSS